MNDTTPTRVVSEGWVKCSARGMDERLDVLRGRADFLARKIHMGQQAPRGRDEKEYAALMWAIAELSGIGDEVRQAAAERERTKASAARKANNRAEVAEALAAQQRVTIKALKAECHELRRRVHAAKSPAVGRVADADDGREALPAPENRKP